MSIEALRWALHIGEQLELEPTMRHVLLILGNRADEQGYLYPSVAWICARTGLARRTVQRQLASIGEAGLMCRDMRANEQGVRTSDGMQLAMEQPGLFVGQRGGAMVTPPRATMTRGGRHSDAGGGATVTPYTQEVKQDQKKERGEAPYVPPDWMPMEAWNAWLNVRTKKKVPNTPRALQIATTKLAELKAEGYPPEKVLDCAIEKGWRGIFKPTELSTGGNGQAGQHRWWESDSAMEAMAKQHGVSTLGKTRFQLKAAIEEKLGQGRPH